jgi:hypothetical protein
MRQRTLVLEDVAQVAAIDPAVAGRAPDEMLCIVRRLNADPVWSKN